MPHSWRADLGERAHRGPLPRHYVRRLPPWSSNAKKRLVRTPKVFVRDSGLVHALLGIREREELLGHPVVGASWEGMVIENVLGALPAGAQTSFYRTSAGAEIDLIIEFGAKDRK